MSKQVIVAIIVSFLAWPLTFMADLFFKNIKETENFHLSMMLIAILILAIVILPVIKFSNVNDWLFYGSYMFAFTSVIDLIITFEYNGLISGFMSEYLSSGEPYLFCSYGSAIALFDGTFFYAMYLLIIHQFSTGKNWRSTGIYWASGIINSMIVLILGIFTGKHSPTYCTFLNVPYVILPIIVLYRALVKEDKPVMKKENLKFQKIDIILALGFLYSIKLLFIKGLGSLGSSYQFVTMSSEPILFYNDPAPYFKIQAIIYLLYSIPLFVICLLSIATGYRFKYLWEVCLILCGLMLQGQFTYIVSAFDGNTPKKFQANLIDLKFWINNLLPCIIPHLLLMRIWTQYDSRESRHLKKKN